MAWTTKLLVLSRETLLSDALLVHMRARAEHAPTEFTVVVPRDRGSADSLLGAASERFAARGLDVELLVGDRDPLMAVRDAWNPAAFDEIIVVTLPSDSSRWLAAGLPFRVQQLTGALVTHLVAERSDVGRREAVHA